MDASSIYKGMYCCQRLAHNNFAESEGGDVSLGRYFIKTWSPCLN